MKERKFIGGNNVTFVNYKGTHVGTRNVSDVFNVYVKEEPFHQFSIPS